MRLTLPAGLLLLVSTLLAGCGGSSNSGGTTPGPVATTTTLSASPNPAISGQTVTLTATVTASSGTPTGAVAFFNGTTSLGAGTLANGVATLALATLPTGADSLTANYPGTAGFQTSTSAAFAEVINAAPVATTTALTASPNPAAAGASVTLTATVASASGTPTGSVAFLDGATTLATVALTNGTATYTTSTLAAGATHNLTAAYAGNPPYTASTSPTVAEVISAAFTANASFSFATPNQTILGFGGAEAFYGNYLDNHPNESQIMSALFNPTTGLGITFLRLQNNFYNYNGSNLSTFDTDNIKLFTAAQAALGAAPTVLLSSWTPPASLKSNNSIDGCTTVTNGNCTGGFGTLAQVTAPGAGYNYAGFGQFWLSSLQAYAAQGLMPTYISIQNEPDFPPSYVGCLFNPTEAPASLYGSTQSYASYGKAFDAVYQALNTSSLASIPKMIGPEAFTVANAQALLTQVPSNELAAVAHHLYGVSSTNGNPQGNVAPETALNTAYPTQLKFETEYYQIPAFDNAVQIHNALTVANDNVYLYWGLTWPSTLANGISTDEGGLLYIDNPFAAQSTWAYPAGWTYNDAYYAMKGYSFFIRPGYVRFNASVTDPDEDVSVYRSPDTKTTVVVLLNTSTTATDAVGLNLSGISYTNSAVYRSSFGTPITSASAERWNALGAYTAAGISMPPQSEVTVVLTQ
jgi:O-glycosyl hydrolase